MRYFLVEYIRSESCRALPPAGPQPHIVGLNAPKRRIQKHRETLRSKKHIRDAAQSAFHPSQRLSLALPLPLGPGLDPAAAGPVPERLELLPNSYCRELPGRPPLAFVLLYCSLHSSLQNHLVRPTGAFSRCTHARWNHSRGQSSLSHAIMLPYDTSLQ